MLTVNDFNVGDQVFFGRGQGEQTRGTIIKVNRAKLKVRQDESRGTHRAYPAGTVWTVPPSLCVKVAGSTPAITAPKTHTPREILAAKGIRKGDIVEFTFRKCDGVLTGTIDRINAKRITIKDVSSDKYPSGVYCGPENIIRKVGTAPAKQAPAKQAPATLTLAVGQPVTFQGFSWTARGTATITGVVTHKNTGKGTYEVYGEGRFHNLNPAQVKMTGKRVDADLVAQAMGVYTSLSPENLTHDGERSRREINAARARLNRALRALWKEAGREITETECWKKC